MQVGSGASSGIADKSDHIPSLDFLSRGDKDFFHMAVFGCTPMAVINDHQIPDIDFFSGSGNPAVGR